MSMDLWLDRERLELYAVACLALGTEPVAPGPAGPSLAVLRRLKDAIEMGQLVATIGPKGLDMLATVSPADLRSYAESKRDAMLQSLCHRWQKRLADGPSIPKAVPTDKAGRPWKYDWDSFWRAVVKIIHGEGVPETQADLIRRMGDWCGENCADPPGDTTLKEHLGPLHRELTLDGK